MTPADDPVDVTRRTWLAEDRTWLAWLRTGLAAVAVAVGVGTVAPELGTATAWPYAVLGAGYGVLGMLLTVYGLIRHREVGAALSEGRPVPGNPLAVVLCVALSAVLALGTVVVVVVD